MLSSPVVRNVDLRSLQLIHSVRMIRETTHKFFYPNMIELYVRELAPHLFSLRKNLLTASRV